MKITNQHNIYIKKIIIVKLKQENIGCFDGLSPNILKHTERSVIELEATF